MVFFKMIANLLNITPLTSNNYGSKYLEHIITTVNRVYQPRYNRGPHCGSIKRTEQRAKPCCSFLAQEMQ